MVSEPIPEHPSPSPRGDSELMALIAEGDRDAFGELIERYKDGVVGYLVRLTGDPDRAEDLAQEAFLRLYRAAPRYREQGQLTAYLFRIATNLLRSEERQERRKRLFLHAFQTTALAQGGAAEAPRGPQRLLAEERRSRLAAALAELPLSYRVPLVLAEIEGWPLKEIADSLELRVGTVKSRLFRARQRLKETLAPYWNGDSHERSTAP